MKITVIVSREPIEEELTRFENAIPYLDEDLCDWTDVPCECIPSNLIHDKTNKKLIQLVLDRSTESAHDLIVSYISHQLTKMRISERDVFKFELTPYAIIMHLEIIPHGQHN